MPFFQTSDGLSLHYQDAGAGVPVLCLAGLTRNTTDFDYITGKLPPARMIKMDYRGRGLSDWAEDYSTYSILRESQDAFELMDHLSIDSFAILGTSRGGLNAMTMGAMQLNRIKGVAFNDIGPEIATEGLEVIMGYLGRNPVVKTFADAAKARPRVMKGFENVPERRWREEVTKFFHQTPQGLINNYDPKLRTAVEAVSLQPTIDLWPFYIAFNGKPVAVLRGENSDLLTQETFAKMQSSIPDAICASVKDRGHVPYLDEPESLDVLTRWIKALS